jgi:hypothetical protein
MITWTDLRDSFWLAGFLLLVSLVVFFIVYGIGRLWIRRSIVSSRRADVVLSGFLVGISLGFTGMIAGFLTGSSRAPAVSALVPAILTFIGLLIVYLIGKGGLRSTIAGFVVFIFSANLLIGIVLGSASRDRHEEYLESLTVQKLKADQEFGIRQYRRVLGLPLDAPKQKTQTEIETGAK